MQGPRCVIEMRYELPVGTAASIALSRALGIAVSIAGACAALVLGVTLGVGGNAVLGRGGHHGVGAGMMVLFGGLWLASRIWHRPAAMKPAAVVVEPGAVTIRAKRILVDGCSYDAAHDVLWLRGPFGVPRACLGAPRDQAWEIACALERPERGLRTMSATPGIVAIPFIGFWIGMIVGCALAFGLVMLVAGPAKVGIPAALVTVPLAILVFRPARVRVAGGVLEWRWWSWTRRVPLASLDRVVATPNALLLHVGGRSRRWPLRTMSGNHGWFLNDLEEREQRRVGAFADTIEELRRDQRAWDAR